MPDFPFRDQILAWYQSITPDQWYYAWVISGFVMAVAWLWWAHGVIRRSLGHVNFRGTWYNAEQAEELVKQLDEDVQRGNRVMRHDEMSLLRRWRFGTDKTIRHTRGSYF